MGYPASGNLAKRRLIKDLARGGAVLDHDGGGAGSRVWRGGARPDGAAASAARGCGRWACR